MSKLDTFIERWRNRGFVWNRADCLNFAREWVLLRTGSDPGPHHEDLGILQGFKEVRKLGGMEGVGDRFGIRIPPLFAQQGDVVLLHSGGPIGRVSGYTFGVCVGSQIAAPSHTGLAFTDLTESIAAWRINPTRS